MSGIRSHRKSALQHCVRPVLEALEGRTLCSAGAVDLSFGTQGAVSTTFAAPHNDAYPATVLVQHNGESIVVGTAGPAQESGTPNQDFALTRYTTSGQLDTTFGTKGEVFTDFNGGDDIAVAAALQSNGDIVVAGISNYTGNSGDFVLARYTTTGALDTTFGNHGRVITNLWSIGGMEATDIALDNQGRIYVLGTDGPTGTDKFAVARYESNGTLDPTFGKGGIAVMTSGPAINYANALAIESDGQIVVVGGTVTGDFYATRLTAAGALDTTFGTGGFTEVSFGNTVRAQAVDIVAGGKIVLSGTGIIGNLTGGDLDLTRLNSNGTLDTTFGTSGKTVTNFGQVANAYGMTIQFDGDILLVGGGTATSTRDSILARYTPSGILDKTFNGNGEVFFDSVNNTTTVGLSDAFAVAVQVDGKIVVASGAGTATQNSQTEHFVLTRFQGDAPGSISGTVFNDANGDGIQDNHEAGLGGRTVYLDMNHDGVFDAGGYYVTTSANGAYTFANLAPGTYTVREVLPSGSQFTTPGSDEFTVTLTAAGNVTGDNFGNQAIAPGVLDQSFGTHGSVTTVFNPPHDYATPVAVLVQHNGESIVVGSAGPGDGVDGSPEPGTYDNALARYTTAGALDPSFGTDGVVFTSFGAADVSPTAAVLQPDGKIIVVGESANNLVIARYTTSGALDTTFGNHGLVQTTLGFVEVEADAVALDSSGRIIVAGQTVGSNFTGYFSVMRFESNGTLDTTFGHDGVARFTSNNLQSPSVHNINIQSDGKIVVSGLAFAGNFFAARLTTSGALDSTFGSGGLADVSFGSNNVATATGAAIVAGGKILLGGTVIPESGNSMFGLARLNANGSLDTTFGTGGTTTTSFGQSEAFAYAMTVQLNGKILLAGNISEGTTNSSLLVRYTSSGTLDSTFNGNGQVVFNSQVSDLYYAFSDAYAVALQVDGKILVAGDAGGAHVGGSFDGFVLSRFFSDAPASISGTVFNDANSDGIQDNGETGLAGQRVYLDLNDNGVYDPADYYVTTDANGNFTFANLAPGTYEVREVLPAGSHLTTPTSGVFTVTLGAGQNVTGENFGEK